MSSICAVFRWTYVVVGLDALCRPMDLGPDSAAFRLVDGRLHCHSLSVLNAFELGRPASASGGNFGAKMCRAHEILQDTTLRIFFDGS